MVKKLSGSVTSRRKVLMIGLDAADTRLLLDGIDKGRYTTLAGLKERGAWGMVAAPRGFGSGAVWPSFATGVSPAKHARYFYRQVQSGSYETTRFEPEHFRAELMWDVLGRQDRRVAVLDVPKVALSTEINGVMAVDWISHGGVYPELRAWPPEFQTELVERFGANPLRKCDRPGGRNEQQMLSFMDVMIDRVEQRQRCTSELWASGEFDMMLTVFAEPHCVGHQAWHVRDPQHPQYDPHMHATIGDPLDDIYQSIDTAIGEIIDTVDSDTVVVVVTATGMGPNYTGNHVLDEVLRRLDGVSATRRSSWTKSVKRSVKSVLPSSLRQRGRPLKRRIEESAAAGDRAQRRAFTVPHNDISGAIRLNIAGREPDGRLRPADVDAYIEELSQQLHALRNADTGGTVVDEVIRISDEQQGAHLAQLPDLFVTWHRDVPIDRVVSDDTGEVEFRLRGNRTGDHNPDCSFFAVGPGVLPGEVSGTSIYDFATTFASVLGLDPMSTDGRVIDALAGTEQTLTR